MGREGTSVWELATELCRRHGYLCLEGLPLGDAGFLAALELAIYETIIFMVEAGMGFEDVVGCFMDEDCLDQLSLSSAEAADYAVEDLYEYSIDKLGALRAIGVIERVIARIRGSLGYN